MTTPASTPEPGRSPAAEPTGAAASPAASAGETPLVEVRGLKKHYPVKGGVLQREKGVVRALDGVDLDLPAGESFSLVGESGSGKTTLGRAIVRLIEPTEGTVRVDGKNLLEMSGKELRRFRRRLQMVFQDPYGSLNPRMKVRSILAEPLAIHSMVPRRERDKRIAELLEMVGLPAHVAERHPHQFSGGQRQRIGIARALATDPDLLVADEPVSALDVSVQAQIVNLLARLQSELGLTLVFIAHDLAVVEQLSDRVAVMYLGRIVEVAPRDRLFGAPQHPYTVSLLSAVPVPEVGGEDRRIVLPGELPSPMNPPSGCPFHPRCPIARPHCAEDTPPLAPVPAGGLAACFYPGELEPPARDGAPDGSPAGTN